MSTSKHIIPNLNTKQLQRFWSRIDKRSPDECWPWTGYRIRQGYGSIEFAQIAYRVHRVAYFLYYHQQPGAFFVCHTCDNPLL